MDLAAGRTNTMDICSVSTVIREETVAWAIEVDFVRSAALALAADVAKRVAMDHFEVEVSLAAVAAVSIVTLEFADTICSEGYFKCEKFENDWCVFILFCFRSVEREVVSIDDTFCR